MKRRALLLASTLIGSAWLSIPAMAQSAPAGDATGSPGKETTSNDAPAFGEVVVTANRREESLQDVPIAVSAYTSERREQLGIRTADDIAKFTPGMSYVEFPNRIILRGVGRVTNTVGSDPGVATYYDGVYNAESWVLAQHPLLIDRIEVLRGPQGTLYGRNSIGGAVNVISKRPTKQFEGQVNLLGGTLSNNRETGFISGPIGRGAGFRISADRNDAPEFIRNVFTGDREGPGPRLYLEGQLETDIGSRANARLIYGYTKSNGGSVPSVLRAPYDTTTYSLGFTVNPTLGYTGRNPGLDDAYTIDSNLAEYRRRVDHRVVGQVTLDLGGAVAKYTGGFNKGHSQYTGDFDASSRISFVEPQTGTTISSDIRNDVFTDSESFSNEFNLTSPEGSRRLNWILGLYQFHERSFQSLQVYIPNQSQIVNRTFTSSFANVPNPKGQVFVNEGEVKTDSFAVFGQASYKIADPLTLTLGARYSWDEKKGTEFQRIVIFDPRNPLLGPTLAYEFQNRRRPVAGDWDGATFRGTLQYELSPDSMFYATVGTGYKAGGFNLGAYSDPVGEEKLTAYELGYKARFGRRLQVNLAGFYYDYKDSQIFTRTCALTNSQGQCGVSVSAFVNAPKARSLGAEVETVWQPADSVQVIANYGYLDAKFVRFNGVADPFNVSGPPLDLKDGSLPLSPKHKFSLTGVYTADLGIGTLNVATTYAFQSRYHYDLYDLPLYQERAGGELSFRVTYRNADGRFNVVGFVENALDAHRIGNVSIATVGAGQFGRSEQAQAPRRAGLELQVPF